MGSRGPVPSRTEDLSRDRDANRAGSVPVTKGKAKPATIPEPDPNWHKIAKMLWDSALESGQSDYYQSSDYAMLYHLCDDLSVYKNAKQRSSMMFQAFQSMFESLLLTEGARRRVRIELESEETEDEGVVMQIDKYRADLKLVKPAA